jgi:2'-5' RNA ligase
MRIPAYAAYYLPPGPVSANLFEFCRGLEELPGLSLHDPLLHLTMGFRFKDEHMTQVLKEALWEGPVSVTLGELRVFPRRSATALQPEEYLVADAHSPALHSLYARLKALLPQSKRHYHPHITLAILSVGEGVKFAGDKRFECIQISLTHFTFSDESSRLHTINLSIPWFCWQCMGSCRLPPMSSPIRLAMEEVAQEELNEIFRLPMLLHCQHGRTMVERLRVAVSKTPVLEPVSLPEPPARTRHLVPFGNKDKALAMRTPSDPEGDYAWAKSDGTEGLLLFLEQCFPEF